MKNALTENKYEDRVSSPTGIKRAGSYGSQYYSV